jgi:hypothetical protein
MAEIILNEVRRCEEAIATYPADQKPQWTATRERLLLPSPHLHSCLLANVARTV